MNCKGVGGMTQSDHSIAFIFSVIQQRPIEHILSNLHRKVRNCPRPCLEENKQDATPDSQVREGRKQGQGNAAKIHISHIQNTDQ
jgi:hypothetical protein